MSHSVTAMFSQYRTRRNGIASPMMPTSIPIRRATVLDADQLADLHRQALPEAFLSHLGSHALAACYHSWSMDHSVIALVATDLCRPVGLLIASVDPAATRARLLRQAIGPLGWALLRCLTDPSRLYGCWESYRAGRGTMPAIPNPPRTELFVLAVEPACQQLGIGRALFHEFRRTLRATGYPDHFGVVVGGALQPAQAFYARMGGYRAATVTVHRTGPPSQYFVFSPTIIRSRP